jgi:hypothetical protein
MKLFYACMALLMLWAVAGELDYRDRRAAQCERRNLMYNHKIDLCQGVWK